MSLSAQDGQQKVNRQISELLSVLDDQGASVSGLDMMVGMATYPFDKEDEGLTEAEVESRLKQQVDKFVGEISDLNADASEDDLNERFNKFKAELLADAQRLIKLELVTQLLTLYVKVEKEEIVFRGDILDHLRTHLNDKEQTLALKPAFNAEAKVTELNNALNSLKESLRSGHFSQVVDLLELFKNRVFYLEKEINAMVLLAQIDSTYAAEKAHERFAAKLEELLALYTHTLSSADEKDNITHLATYLQDELSSSIKSGSKVGILPFKRIVPTIVGSFIKATGLSYSHEIAYEYAKEYLKAITSSTNIKKEVVAFLQQLIEDKSRFFTIHDLVDKVSPVDALKAVDIIKRLPYDDQVMGEWWVVTLANLPKILEAISAELIDGVETTKLIVNTRVSDFGVYPEYSTGLYNLFMEAVADLGEQMADQDSWMPAFLDYVNERFEEKDTPTGKFLHKWYPMVMFNTLLFRTTNDGFVVFKDFNAGEYAALHQEFLKEVQEKTKKLMFNFFPMNLEKFPVQDMPKKYKSADAAGLKYLAHMIGKKIPYINFKQEKVNLTVKETEVNLQAGGGATHQSTGYRMQDSTVRRDALKKIVPPSNQETSPIKKETTQVNEELAPIVNKPVITEPVINQPIIQEEQIVKEEPIINQPIINQPIITEPVITEPIITEPIVNDAIIKEEPVVDIKLPIGQKEQVEEDNSHQSPVFIPLKDIEEDEDTPTNNLPLGHKTPSVHSDTGLDSPIFNKINGSPHHNEDPIGVQLTGEEIPTHPISLTSMDSKHEDWDNMVEVVKGQLDPEMVLKLQKTPDLFEFVSKQQIVTDEDGNETWYYYVQVVEKASACYDSIVE